MFVIVRKDVRVCNGIRVAPVKSNFCFKAASVYFQQKLSSDQSVQKPTQDDQKKAKTTPLPKITLISQDNVSIVTLAEAEKLSKRRDLRLVKIVDLDTKTQRPVYKLMTGAEFHQEDLKQREHRKKEKNDGAIKGEKVLMLSPNIAEHDLKIHINKILKWVSKKLEVRVIINGGSSSMQQAENVYNLLEHGIQHESRIVQKRVKGNDIKFQIIPPKKDKENTENS